MKTHYSYKSMQLHICLVLDVEENNIAVSKIPNHTAGILNKDKVPDNILQRYVDIIEVS